MRKPPVSFLTPCKVYSQCLRCGTTIKSTRGQKTHLHQCCFRDAVPKAPQQENITPNLGSDSIASGSKRSHSVCASSSASNACSGLAQPHSDIIRQQADAVLQLDIYGGTVRFSACRAARCLLRLFAKIFITQVPPHRRGISMQCC